MANDPVFPPDVPLGHHIGLGLRGLCPKCGRGRLFESYLKVADRCTVCGLDFSGHDTGDGPVVPVMLVVGGLIVGLALWLELAYAPSLWVHIALWIPLTIGLSLIVLPMMKGVNIALQHRYRTTQGGTEQD